MSQNFNWHVSYKFWGYKKFPPKEYKESSDLWLVVVGVHDVVIKWITFQICLMLSVRCLGDNDSCLFFLLEC